MLFYYGRYWEAVYEEWKWRNISFAYHFIVIVTGIILSCMIYRLAHVMIFTVNYIVKWRLFLLLFSVGLICQLVHGFVFKLYC